MAKAETIYDGRLKRNKDRKTSIKFQVEARLAEINGWPKTAFADGQLLKTNKGDHLRVSESVYSEKSQEWKYTVINERRIPATKIVYMETQLNELLSAPQRDVKPIDDIWDNLALWAGALR